MSSLPRNRVAFALDHLQPSDWRRFEQFASAFLVTDYPNLRTVANPGGDDGRDAELFSPDGEPATVLQYSVTKYWSEKIKKTVQRLSKTCPAARMLVYVTNQRIGSKADDLKHEIRKSNGLALDIHDADYFLDRYAGDTHRETEAAALARDIVDPILSQNGILERRPQVLNSAEARAALMYLELQWADDSRDKGLTKLAFEALVRMALHHTHSEARLTRTQVHLAVARLLPQHDSQVLARQTDSALHRLTKRVVRHWIATDEFCLSHEEVERLRNRMIDSGASEGQLNGLLDEQLMLAIPEDECPAESRDLLLRALRRSMEKFLLSRGELFASAVREGTLHQLGFQELRDIVAKEIREARCLRSNDASHADTCAAVAERVLTSTNAAVSDHIQGLASAYTLFAFLQQAPDVQNAVQKMFSSGEVWIDTSIVLPLLAEVLLPSPEWRFRKMISAAVGAGMKFKVTQGVVEEVERHMNRAKACASLVSDKWQGSVPFLLSFYISCGMDRAKFTHWLETFCGQARPEDDISEYLFSSFGIETGSLDKEANSMPAELRYGVKELWIEIHEDRRSRYGGEIDPILASRLAEHDTENYVGVIGKRTSDRLSPFGYSAWWLTLDRKAFAISELLSSRISGKPPASPVMSADFLANYLVCGPVRGLVAKNSGSPLPVALDSALIVCLTPELVALADSVRTKSVGLSEHVIRRKVRDALDSARRRTGSITHQGLAILSEEVADSGY